MTGALRLIVLAVPLSAFLAGCFTTPTGNDSDKQERPVRHDPTIRLALRRSRNDRKSVCQVFLLTGSKSPRVHDAALRLAGPLGAGGHTL